MTEQHLSVRLGKKKRREAHKIEIGQLKREWRGWLRESCVEFFEADEWVEFDNEAEYNEEGKRLKKLGYKVYYQDDSETLFI